VAQGFVAEVTGGSGMRGRNLEEAALCAILVATAQASHGQGGAWLPVPRPRPLVAAPGAAAAGGRR
jgi:hypothetical protein